MPTFDYNHENSTEVQKLWLHFFQGLNNNGCMLKWEPYPDFRIVLLLQMFAKNTNEIISIPVYRETTEELRVGWIHWFDQIQSRRCSGNLTTILE